MERHADRYCSAFGSKIQFGGVIARYVTANFINDRFARLNVALKPEDFSAVVAALAEKFGPPTSVETPEFKTRGGLVTTNTIAIWLIGDGKIVAEKFSTAIDTAHVQYIDNPSSKVLEERRKKAVTEAAKTL